MVFFSIVFGITLIWYTIEASVNQASSTDTDVWNFYFIHANAALPAPEFGESPEELEVTSFRGQTTRLPCTVRHLGGKQVGAV